MEWKYKMIFLLLLLCLVGIGNSYSQNCITMQYDRNGNRISMLVHHCGDEFKSQETDNMIDAEITEKEESQDILIYPNPNDGIFNISFDDSNSILVQIYNINGVMIKSECLQANDNKIDMTDNPSGVYLLRIVKEEDVCSRVVVKL